MIQTPVKHMDTGLFTLYINKNMVTFETAKLK